jgi:hypothetical protein
MLVELSGVEQRYLAVMEVASGGVPVIEGTERYGRPHKTVPTWLGRYRHECLAGLADRSHRPHHHPGQLAAEVEARMSSCAEPILVGWSMNCAARGGLGAVVVDGLWGADPPRSGRRTGPPPIS